MNASILSILFGREGNFLRTAAAAIAAIFLTLSLVAIVPARANAATAGDVVITELMANPVSVTDSNGEWIEIMNNSGSEISLDSWDIDGSTISPSITLAANARAVVCRNQDALVNDGVVCDAQASGMSLSNSEDTINLRDDNNLVIDTVIYTSSNITPGHSTNLPGLDSDYTNQYSQNNFGTPANNSLLPRSTQIRVHAVVDGNGNNFPDWKDGVEPHQAGWEVRLYRDVGASEWSYLDSVVTTGKYYRESATMHVVPGEYYACLVNKPGYTQTFAKTITGWYSLPDNSVASDSPQDDEGSRCIHVDTTGKAITSHVFGSAEQQPAE